MMGKEFLRALANDKADVLQTLLNLLRDTKSPYCVIGGLAVNAYVEPVVSLDLDIVVIAANRELICEKAKDQRFRIRRFEHSLNLSAKDSDLRVQIQTDERYQPFIARARSRQVLGYRMRVARLEDVLAGKLWAFQDETRRKSKRQKDLADIARLVEAHPSLGPELPAEVRRSLQ
jgi:hypothetical protein